MNSDLDAFPTVISNALPLVKLSQTGGKDGCCQNMELNCRVEDIIEQMVIIHGVPSVWSKSLGCMRTQTGDGHDTDVQIQAMFGFPGLISLCINQTRNTDK